MIIIKNRISIQTALATIAIAVLFVTAVQAGETDMKSLVVKLDFDSVPDECTCEGMDVSPMIEIQGLNATTMAIIVDDPDAPSGTFTHWLIWNIPPTDVIPRAIAKNAVINEPFTASQGTNDFGEIGYAGPCPPPGKPHRYFFRVFGLDRMLDLKAGKSAKDLQKAMQGHVLQKGEAVATYGR
ncbi:MAG: YbhB/YbcL family Raf kinase inhibitor-like protein [Methanotrichaceae archaeon]|nr:YbhB/YbcL family Raf kinase inhibitor-like protein [Methanotrichaceae archaeon]